MAMNVTPFVGTDNFNMETFNNMISQINNGVNSEISDVLAQLGTKAKIQTGSYVGTGTYGADNPCSLTFDTLPKMLMIPLKDPSNGSNGLQFNSTGYQSPKRPLFLFDTIKSYDSYTRADAFGHQVFIKIDGTNFSWYSLDNNTYQSNEINATYYWVAFY